jgi:hypothetical protein
LQSVPLHVAPHGVFRFGGPKVNSQHRDQTEALGQRKVVVGMLLPLDGVAEACPRWIAAVNHWGRLGHWNYAKIHSPHQLEVVLGDWRRDP